MHPGSLALSKTGTIMRYILETTKTGDPKYGLRRFANGMFPLIGVIDNFSEYGRGKMAFDKATESIKQFSPDPDVNFYRGETVLAGIQRVSPYKQKSDTLLSAISRARHPEPGSQEPDKWAEADAIWSSLKDDVQAREAPPGIDFDKAEQYVGKMSGIDAQRKLNNMLRSRNPLSYARKSSRTKSELESDLSNMLMKNGGSAKNEKDYHELFEVLKNFNEYWQRKSISTRGIYDSDPVLKERKSGQMERRSRTGYGAGASPKI
jgi:hypothetical protein